MVKYLLKLYSVMVRSHIDVRYSNVTVANINIQYKIMLKCLLVHDGGHDGGHHTIFC